MKKLFGTDGIRGVFGEELDLRLAYDVGLALAKMLSRKCNKPKIVVGMDTRESSAELNRAICQGIGHGGGIAYDAEVCTTPEIAFLILHHGFDSGVMISASHNPYQYNGIKIFGGDGLKLSDAEEDELEIAIRSGLDESHGDNQAVKKLADAKESYIHYLKNCFGVSLSGMKIGLDCANGSACVSAAELFRSLGAECLVISDAPNGRNINDGCGSTDIAALCRLVSSNGLDIGFAFDGDGDRCIAVSNDAAVVDGDHILAILALSLRENGRLKNNTLVGTVMSNAGLEKFCENHGIKFIGTAVGDRRVLEAMTNGGYVLGGEQSGHIILRDYSTTGDGQLTALAVASYVKSSGKTLKDLSCIMKKLPEYTVNISASEEDKQALESSARIQRLIKLAKIEMGGDGRIVIRPSGTEPMIRIQVQATSRSLAKSTCEELRDKIKKELSKTNE